ncbi:MAG: hypothetical protein ABIK62_03635 [candidate division WOR-3 bacterium]
MARTKNPRMRRKAEIRTKWARRRARDKARAKGQTQTAVPGSRPLEESEHASGLPSAQTEPQEDLSTRGQL